MISIVLMTTYAYCLGVNNYIEPITSLKCAERDARDLAALFKYELGYQAEYLEETKTEDIEKRIADLGDRLKAGDTFIFYFSGHGKSHNDDQYFLLSGCRPATLERGCAVTGGVLSWNALRSLTSEPEWQGVQSVFIFDACRTPLIATKGGAENSSSDFAYLLRHAFGKHREKTEAPDLPLTVINSCADEKCSIELTSTGHGVFTEAMMDWFMQASKLGKELVLNEQFIADVSRRMRVLVELNKLAHLSQYPVLRGKDAHLELRDVPMPTMSEDRRWQASRIFDADGVQCPPVGRQATPAEGGSGKKETKRTDSTQDIYQQTIPGIKPLIKPEPEIIYPSNPLGKTSRHRNSRSFQGKVMLEMAGVGKTEVPLNHELLIGRAQINAIRTDDAQTSRVHARLYLAGGKVMLCDQGSINGTYLNDVLISNPVAIGDGDCIRVGKTKIKVYF